MERNGWRQVINRYFRAIALLLMICLLPGVACAEYVGSTPDNGVYLVQSQAHTCTLISATMMLRNYAYMKDNFYEHVTESAVRSNGWNNLGLLWDFNVGSVNVQVSHDIRTVADKKQYLIDRLTEHKEGIVIYDANAPHAIYLFGYDEETDIFYCADTTTDIAGKAIPLVFSILPGESQEEKIATLDRIWYVAPHGTGI